MPQQRPICAGIFRSVIWFRQNHVTSSIHSQIWRVTCNPTTHGKGVMMHGPKLRAIVACVLHNEPAASACIGTSGGNRATGNHVTLLVSIDFSGHSREAFFPQQGPVSPR